MKKLSLHFLKVLIPFTLLLFTAQYFITKHAFSSYEFYYSTWSIYLFHFIVTFLIYMAVLVVHKNLEEKTGFAFLACSGLKMFAAVVFLIPVIKGEAVDSVADIGAFFIPYFLFLFLETIFAVKLLK